MDRKPLLRALKLIKSGEASGADVDRKRTCKTSRHSSNVWDKWNSYRDFMRSSSSEKSSLRTLCRISQELTAVPPAAVLAFVGFKA
jgi:hypothetical protein